MVLPFLPFFLIFFFKKNSDAAEAILLGFQHYLVMLGTTVIIPTALVPQMGGGNVRLSSPSLIISLLANKHL